MCPRQVGTLQLPVRASRAAVCYLPPPAPSKVSWSRQPMLGKCGLGRIHTTSCCRLLRTGRNRLHRRSHGNQNWRDHTGRPHNEQAVQSDTSPAGFLQKFVLRHIVNWAAPLMEKNNSANIPNAGLGFGSQHDSTVDSTCSLKNTFPKNSMFFSCPQQLNR